MTAARVTELSATSAESFEEALDEGVERATGTLRNVESAWVKDMNVLIEDGDRHRVQGKPGHHVPPRGRPTTRLEETNAS
jgi:dodecin